MLNLPHWAKARIGGIAVWQWLGFTSGLPYCSIVDLRSASPGTPPRAQREDGSGLFWPALLTPLAIIIAAAFVIPLVCAILRISGTPLIATVFARTAVLFLTAAWLSVVGGGMIGEAIAASEHLSRRRLDSQLVRLGTRFAGVVIGYRVPDPGRQRTRFPGLLGCGRTRRGGLAVALAARDSLANLFGSMLIMFEKPFRVGDTSRSAEAKARSRMSASEAPVSARWTIHWYRFRTIPSSMPRSKIWLPA